MHFLSKSFVTLSLAGAMVFSYGSFSQAARRDKSAEKVTQVEGLGMISGTITGADGKSLGGVAVGLQYQTPKKQDGTSPATQPTTKPTPIQTTKTDANGHYAFEKVKPGTYVVFARDKQNGNFRKQVVLGESQEVTLDMKLKPKGAKKDK